MLSALGSADQDEALFQMVGEALRSKLDQALLWMGRLQLVGLVHSHQTILAFHLFFFTCYHVMLRIVHLHFQTITQHVAGSDLTRPSDVEVWKGEMKLFPGETSHGILGATIQMLAAPSSKKHWGEYNASTQIGVYPISA